MLQSPVIRVVLWSGEAKEGVAATQRIVSIHQVLLTLRGWPKDVSRRPNNAGVLRILPGAGQRVFRNFQTVTPIRTVWQPLVHASAWRATLADPREREAQPDGVPSFSGESVGLAFGCLEPRQIRREKPAVTYQRHSRGQQHNAGESAEYTGEPVMAL